MTSETFLDGLQVPRAIVRINEQVTLIHDQAGKVEVRVGKNLRSEPLADVRKLILKPEGQFPELGLSGFALAPDFARSGIYYTLTTEEPTKDEKGYRMDRLRRWVANPREHTTRGESTVLLSIPYSDNDHAGGGIAFDDNGRLLIGVGSPTGDDIGLDPTSLSGKILRIMPTADGYRVPSDNPFATGGGAKEVFALGYRNPFRLHFDDEVGLIVAEPMFVEKDQQVGNPKAGDNAGYPAITTADACWTDQGLAPHCATDPNGRPITAPVVEYGSDIGQIVSGAVIVRGARTNPALVGRALIADWEGSLLLATPGQAPWSWQELDTTEADLDDRLWDLDADADGNLYAMMTNETMSAGSIRLLSIG